MNFEQPQQEPTLDTDEKKQPSNLDAVKRKVGKLKTLLALGVALLPTESFAAEGEEQKDPPKAPPPIVQKEKGSSPIVEGANTNKLNATASKIESSEHTAENLLMSFLGAMSRDRLEKSPDGAVFLELDFNFYKLESSDLIRLRNSVMQLKFPSIYTNYFDLPKVLSRGRGLALEYRIQLDISKNCKPIEKSSLLPPKMRARFEEVRGIDFNKLRENMGANKPEIKTVPTESSTDKNHPKINVPKENTPKNKPFISTADDF